MKHLALVALAASAALCAPVFAAAPPPGAIVQLKGADGLDVGSVQVVQAPQGLLIEIEAHGLTPGWHGLHIHEKGDCAAPAFTSAGAHVHAAGTAAVHGFLTAEGGEPGDLPNLWVGQDGMGKAQVFSDRLTLTPAAGRLALWDADGSAIVIHAARDDHYTQPIGGSGARIGCGVLGR